MRESLKLFMRSDHNELALYWITRDYVTPVSFLPGHHLELLDGHALSLPFESQQVPAFARQGLTQRMADVRRGDAWDALFRSFTGWASPEGLVFDDHGLSVHITPDGYHAVERRWHRPVVLSLNEHVVLGQMIARLRELMADPRVARAITRAMRARTTIEAEIRI